VTASLFGFDANAVRPVLSVIAESLIVVTSLAFSLTLGTLQLASGQFAPRFLRNAQNRVRVVRRRRGVCELHVLSVGQPWRYGAGDVYVLSRMFWLLRELACSSDLPPSWRAIGVQVACLSTASAGWGFDDAELGQMIAGGARRGRVRSPVAAG